MPLVSRATSAKAIGRAEKDNLSFYFAASVPVDLKRVQCPKMQMCTSSTKVLKKEKNKKRKLPKKAKNILPILKVLQGGDILLNELHLITPRGSFNISCGCQEVPAPRETSSLLHDGTNPTQTETQLSDVTSYKDTFSGSGH